MFEALQTDGYQLTNPRIGSDILKIAMIHLDQALEAGAYKTKMLLQVHDEIVL